MPKMRKVKLRVGGRKQLAGQTDLDMAISNQCARLIANVVIAYNSVLLSKLLERYQATDNQKALQLLQKISPGGTFTSSGATCSAANQSTLMPSWQISPSLKLLIL